MTAIFTDVIGSTASAEGMDPEDVHQRLQPYFELVRRELERYGGTLEKYVGDAVVAIFGAPVSHEDDPERAVRAGLAICAAIDDLNASDSWLELSIRVGVNTGEALLVVGSNPSLELGMAAGDAINTAARIQSAAPVNGVLVGELTYRATRDVIEYQPAEPIEAKGKSEPVPVWVAVRALEHSDRRRGRRTPLVGRDAELGQLLGVWDEVRREGLPGLAFVTGLPGIGKSRLLEELESRIEESGGAAHWGRCLPYGEGITYWPVMDIVKSAAGILQTDETEVVSAKLGALLEVIDIDEADERRTTAVAVSNLLGVSTTPRGTYQAGQITQAEFHWGIRRVLQLLARQRPLGLVFEDLHWAEPTLIELLSYLTEEGAEGPLLVVASARPEALEKAPELVREGARACNLPLEALTGEAGQELLRDMLGSDELAASPAAATLLRTAGGNPLFLEETVQALRDAGMVDDEGWHLEDENAELPTPTSLQGLIGSRLDQLARPEKRIAQHASVAGSVFWPGAVSHLQGEASQNGDLVGHLETLEGRDLVREHEISSVADEREYEFKHIMIRDVAYGQLPKGRRIELHMRFAEWMKVLPVDEFIEITAWHLERACRLAREVARSPVEPPVTEAVAALTRAGEKAERREGMREAERFYIRALELVDDEHELALELKLRRARMLIQRGKVEQAVELLGPIAEQAREAGRDELRCEALIALAHVDHRQGRTRQAQRRLTEAQELAAKVADRCLQIRAAYHLAGVKGDVPGAFEDAMDELMRAIGIAEEIDDRALQVEGQLRAGFLLYNLGDLARAETALARCSELAAELGSSRDEARATLPLSVIKYLRGELEEAERLGEQARAAFERTGETYFQIQNLSAMGQFALARGDTALAEERLREALPLALEESSWLVAEVYRLLTESLIRQDRVADAEALVEFADRSSWEEHPYAQAAVLLAGAVLATAKGDPQDAAKRYGEAVALLDELGLPIELNHARIAYGRALSALGEYEEAHEQLERARGGCKEMGATGLLRDVERVLNEIGGRAGVPGPAPEAI